MWKAPPTPDTLTHPPALSSTPIQRHHLHRADIAPSSARSNAGGSSRNVPPSVAGSSVGGGRKVTTPPFRTGMSSRGPPSVAESMASEALLSADTRALFKNMMRASKLTLRSTIPRHLVKDGYSLPSTPQPGMTGRMSVEPSEGSISLPPMTGPSQSL
ncbi:hypothetical protein BC829DRAFT_299297 [Chytridium lagenaria]|nr:hypothetical protein BC829DRAFT_299297 [Chytridium lagenaria]